MISLLKNILFALLLFVTGKAIFLICDTLLINDRDIAIIVFSAVIVVVFENKKKYEKQYSRKVSSNNVKSTSSELISEQPKLSGFYQQGDCSLERKVSRVKAAFSLDEFESIYAYGDTHEDIPMLKLADYAMLNWIEWRASK